MTCLKLLTVACCCLVSTGAWAATSTVEGADNNEATVREAGEPAAVMGPGAATADSPSTGTPAVNGTTNNPSPAATAAVGPSPYGAAKEERGSSPPEPSSDSGESAPETLWNSKYDYAFGGMGGLGVMYTRFGGRGSVLVCGEGAVIIDHALTLGGGGCGLVERLKAQDYARGEYDTDERLTFGYGGAIGRYHFRSRKMVNFSVGILVGAGGITTGTWNDGSDEWDSDSVDVKRSDALFIVEPQLGTYLNITRWLRAGAMVGYRVAAGIDTVGLSAGEVSGVVAGGQLQGGWF